MMLHRNTPVSPWLCDEESHVTLSSNQDLSVIYTTIRFSRRSEIISEILAQTPALRLTLRLRNDQERQGLITDDQRTL